MWISFLLVFGMLIIFVVLICVSNGVWLLNYCHNKLKGLSARATMMAGFPLWFSGGWHPWEALSLPGLVAPSPLFLRKFFIDRFYSKPSDCCSKELNSPEFSGLCDKEATLKPSFATPSWEDLILFLIPFFYFFSLTNLTGFSVSYFWIRAPQGSYEYAFNEWFINGSSDKECAGVFTLNRSSILCLCYLATGSGGFSACLIF